MLAQIETKDCGRALIGADPFGRWNLRQLPKLASGKRLADVRPCLFQTERRVHVAHKDFGLFAPFLPGGLDIVFEDILPNAVGIFGRARRLAVEEPAILPQPASPVRKPVVGVLGVRHQDSVVLSPIAGFNLHPAQPFTQRRETVRFPGFVQIPERHFKLFQFPFDRPNGVSTGVSPFDGLSPALFEPALEFAFPRHGFCISGTVLVPRRQRRIRVWQRSFAMTNSSSAQRTVRPPGHAPVATYVASYPSTPIRSVHRLGLAALKPVRRPSGRGSVRRSAADSDAPNAAIVALHRRYCEHPRAAHRRSRRVRPLASPRFGGGPRPRWR